MNISVNEYKVLSNCSNKIMFFCSLCFPKVSIALNKNDRDSVLSSNYKTMYSKSNQLATKTDVCLSDQLAKAKHGLNIRLVTPHSWNPLLLNYFSNINLLVTEHNILQKAVSDLAIK